MYEILGEKSFFQSFNIFFCFDLNVIFGFFTTKLIKVPIFIKIQWTKLKIWTKMHYHEFPRWPPRGWKRGIVAQIVNRNISETIWDRNLKFGTFIYFHSMYICSKFHWNLRRWVSGLSQFDVEFPLVLGLILAHLVKNLATKGFFFFFFPPKICQSLDNMVSYHQVQYQKKIMIQSWENLVMDGWTDRQTDQQTDGQTDENDYFIGLCPNNVSIQYFYILAKKLF